MYRRPFIRKKQQSCINIYKCYAETHITGISRIYFFWNRIAESSVPIKMEGGSFFGRAESDTEKTS